MTDTSRCVSPPKRGERGLFGFANIIIFNVESGEFAPEAKAIPNTIREDQKMAAFDRVDIELTAKANNASAATDQTISMLGDRDSEKNRSQ